MLHQISNLFLSTDNFYVFEIEFANIKKIAVKYDGTTERYTVLIQCDIPCSCIHSRYNPQTQTRSFSQCQSLMNLGEGEETPFLNYWNLDQTFLIEGQSSVDQIENLIQIVRLKNLHV